MCGLVFQHTYGVKQIQGKGYLSLKDIKLTFLVGGASRCHTPYDHCKQHLVLLSIEGLKGEPKPLPTGGGLGQVDRANVFLPYLNTRELLRGRD